MRSAAGWIERASPESSIAATAIDYFGNMERWIERSPISLVLVTVRHKGISPLRMHANELWAKRRQNRDRAAIGVPPHEAG
jgi:hypothetical protein